MTQTTQRSTVVGVFHEREDAREAIEALKDAGFASDSISILSPDKRATESMAEETGTHAGSAATTGAVAGGVLGGLGGWLVGIGAWIIPGIGPFIAAGALATTIAGVAIGAGVGAIAGALVGMGIPKEEAEYYEGEVKSGRTLVTVRADSRYAEAQQILRQHRAYDIESRDQAAARPMATERLADQPVRAAAPATAAMTDAEQQTLRLHEEELQARKTPVQTGEVTLGKEVVEQEKTLEVPVRREEVYVERHPVERRPADRPLEADEQRTIEVPVTTERVEVDKQPVVYEEVGARTQQVVHNQAVSDTVRREELRVDQQGSARVAGVGSDVSSGPRPGMTPAATGGATSTAGIAGTTVTWDQVMPTYRQRWQQRFGADGGRWEDYEPGYRYGYDLRSRPEYRGRSWAEIEPEVGRDWSAHHPETPWARVRDSVREGWEELIS